MITSFSDCGFPVNHLFNPFRFSDCGFPVNHLFNPFRCFWAPNSTFTARQPLSSAASSGQVPKPRSGAPQAQDLTAMRHAERQSFGLSLASPSHLGEIAVVPAFASAVDAPRGSCFSSRSTRGRLTMGCEGRTLQSLSRTRSARRPRAGRYAQSSEPRPRGTSLAGGEPWAISCASTWRRMPRSRRGSNGTHCRSPTCGA
jgi:hypothetical protein